MRGGTPLKYLVEEMVQGDIQQVVEIDRESYPLPWPASAYRRELHNRQAHYFVLREDGDETREGASPPRREARTWRSILGWPRAVSLDGSRRRGRLVGYAGMWIIADEAHITTIAVRVAQRGHGYGELLLTSMISRAYDLSVRWVTLEVRVSNELAQALYRKYSFHNAGRRRRYYSDNNEDALIMTTDDITLNAYRAQFGVLSRSLEQRLQGGAEDHAHPRHRNLLR